MKKMTTSRFAPQHGILTRRDFSLGAAASLLLPGCRHCLDRQFPRTGQCAHDPDPEAFSHFQKWLARAPRSPDARWRRLPSPRLAAA